MKLKSSGSALPREPTVVRKADTLCFMTWTGLNYGQEPLGPIVHQCNKDLKDALDLVKEARAVIKVEIEFFCFDT